MSGSTVEQRRRNALIVAGTLALTVVLYANTFRNGFLEFDDPDNVLDNYSIRALTWPNVEHYFTTPLQYMYTPLVSLSYALDYHVGALNPVAYHATNLGLHLANIVLVYRLCRALTRKAFIAHFVTVAFAIHPSNVDTVCWVSTRSTLLATLFSLATLLAYLRYTRTRRWLWLALAVLLFVLAVLSKSTAVALALVLPVLDYCRGRRFGWRLVVEKLPFGAVALGGGLLTLHFRIDTSALQHYSPLDRVIVVCSALTGYLIRLVVPYPLAFAYAYPAKAGGFLPWYLYLTPVVLGLVVFLLYRAPVPRKLLLFGLSFFVLNVLLSQTALLEDNYMSNRYVYLPYVGLFLIVAELVRGLVEARNGWRARLLAVWPAALVVVAVLLGVATFSRTVLWNEPARVLDNSITHQPGVPFVYNSRGMTEYTSGDYAAAERDFEKTLALDPTFTLSYYYRGVIRSRGGDNGGAIADYDRAIALSSGFGAAYDERGKAELALGSYEPALTDLTYAISLDGYFVDAYLNRGRVYAALRRYPEAIADYRTAAQLYPDFPDTYNDLGVAELAYGDPQAAVADLTTAIQRNPQYGEAYFHRGEARQRMNDPAAACTDWRTSATYGYPAATQSVQADCPSG
ncbi:MAG TPA: tetratricopeptide repeat protein [Rugosimonospora sp.]